MYGCRWNGKLCAQLTSLPDLLSFYVQGIDIPDVELVVQFQVPNKFCTLFQRFGRGARHRSCLALVVLIAEPKYFDDTKETAKQRAAKRRITQATRKRMLEDGEVSSPRKRQHTGSLLPSIKKEEPDNTQLLADISASDNSGSTTGLLSSGSGAVTVRPKRHDNETEEVMDSFINAPQRRHAGNTSACCRVPGNQYFANPTNAQGNKI